MMRLFLLALLATASSAFGQVQFEQVAGFGLDEMGHAGFEDANGNYVAVGFSQDVNTGVKDIYTVKFDSAGNVLWEMKYGGAGAEEGYGGALHDDRYLIFGSTGSFGAGSNDYYLTKTREDGSVIWSKTFGGTGNDIGRDVIVTSDGGYAMVGYSSSPGTNGSFDGYVVKTDSAGNVDWEKWYGGAAFEFPIRLTETYDGGFIVTSQSTSFGSNYQWYTTRTDSNGDTLWTRLFGTAGPDFTHEAVEAADSGIVIVGTTLGPVDSAQLTLVKYDKSGNQLWVKYPRLTKGDRPYGIRATSDGGFLITGQTSTFDRNLQMLLMKVDANGDSLWVKTFGATGNEFALQVNPASDGGWFLSGVTDGFNTTNIDLFVVKTDSAGNPPCPENTLMSADTNEVCIGETVSFTNSSISSATAAWFVNDVLQSNSWSFAYTFPVAGLHEVDLVICDDTASVQVLVNPLPDAGFTFVQNGNTFDFTLNDSGGAATVLWQFGDGDTSVAISPTHSFSSSGSFNVTAIVTDTNGCQNFFSDVVVVVGLEHVQVPDYEVFPNPFDDHLFFELSQPGRVVLELVDVSGRVAVHEILETSAKVDVSRLEPGMYVMRVLFENGFDSRPVVKVR